VLIHGVEGDAHAAAGEKANVKVRIADRTRFLGRDSKVLLEHLQHARLTAQRDAHNRIVGEPAVSAEDDIVGAGLQKGGLPREHLGELAQAARDDHARDALVAEGANGLRHPAHAGHLGKDRREVGAAKFGVGAPPERHIAQDELSVVDEPGFIGVDGPLIVGAERVVDGPPRRDMVDEHAVHVEGYKAKVPGFSLREITRWPGHGQRPHITPGSFYRGILVSKTWGGVMAPEGPRPVKRKPEPGQDTAGHEFAGEGGIGERIGPPRPAPSTAGGRPLRPVPRAPKELARPAPPPAPANRAPDPGIAGSKYFTPSESQPSQPRQMSSVNRERSTDTDALDTTIEDDLGEVTRRRERERAAQGAPTGEEGPLQTETGSSQTHREPHAEARPRELDFSAPNMPRKRRNTGPL
jgi:hypothetical protein